MSRCSAASSAEGTLHDLHPSAPMRAVSARRAEGIKCQSRRGGVPPKRGAPQLRLPAAGSRLRRSGPLCVLPRSGRRWSWPHPRPHRRRTPNGRPLGPGIRGAGPRGPSATAARTRTRLPDPAPMARVPRRKDDGSRWSTRSTRPAGDARFGRRCTAMVYPALVRVGLRRVLRDLHDPGGVAGPGEGEEALRQRAKPGRHRQLRGDVEMRCGRGSECPVLSPLTSGGRAAGAGVTRAWPGVPGQADRNEPPRRRPPSGRTSRASSASLHCRPAIPAPGPRRDPTANRGRAVRRPE